MGRFRLGVRSSSLEVHEALRRALATHLVAGVAAPANYSLLVAGDHRGFHLLYRGCTNVLRTRDGRRLLEGLFAWLSSHGDDTPPQPARLRLDALGLVYRDVAVLAPAELRHVMAPIERALNRQGLRVVDRPWADLAVGRGELVIPQPAVHLDRSGLEAVVLEALRPSRADPPVAAGRYPLAGWAFAVAAGRTGPLSRVEAVALAARLVRNVGNLGAGPALSGLSDVLRHTRPVAIWANRPREVVAPLADLARGD